MTLSEPQQNALRWLTDEWRQPPFHHHSALRALCSRNLATRKQYGFFRLTESGAKAKIELGVTGESNESPQDDYAENLYGETTFSGGEE